MRVLQLFIEIIFIGSLALLAFNALFSSQLIGWDALTQIKVLFTFDFILLAWVVGFFINIFSDIFLTPVYRWIEARWLLREGNPELVLERLRYDLYVSASSKEIIQRMEYHRSLIRLSRCILFGSIAFTLLAMLTGHYNHALLASSITLFAFLAYYRALIWSIKSTYYSWVSVKHIKPSAFPEAVSNKLPPLRIKQNMLVDSLPDTQEDKHIVAFTGGTGFRDINISLAQKTQNITRVVPIWDNGGSSKALRECFHLLPVGDIRHALMTQAHGEGRDGSIVKLFNWRLSDSGNNKELFNELESFVNNQHPLMKSLDPSLGNVIANYLKRFYESVPQTMDLKNGSIGNFILVGAYLAHNKDINTAIYVFRQLCSIHGNVWPVSVANDLHIHAHLEEGQTIIGQSKTTHIDRSKSQLKINSITFSDDLDADKKTEHVPTQANPMVLDALQKADVIVFGPGSFFTSVLPHIKVEGIVDAIASQDTAKIFVGNLLEDNECYGYSLEEIIDIFINTCNQHAKIKRPANRYITHIIAHHSHTVTDYTHNDRHYLHPGKNINRFNNEGISIITNDFENPWKRGGHDPSSVSDYLISVSRHLYDKPIL